MSGKKKTQIRHFSVMLVGFRGPCSRSFTLWAVKRGKKNLSRLPSTRGEMQNKGIANGVSQILQNFGFLSKHEKGKAQENTQLLDGQKASTHISQPLP